MTSSDFGGRFLTFFSILLALSFMMSSALGIVVNINEADQERLRLLAHRNCSMVMLAYFQDPPTETHCEATWDEVLCWPATPPGQTVVVPCPNYVDGFETDKKASRTCTKNGTWFVNPLYNKSWTNYSQCMLGKQKQKHLLLAEHLPRITLMYNIGYGCSLVSLVLALVIMLYFRKLRCPRNTIHVNLFVSMMLRACFSFMKENMLVEGVGFQADVRTTEDGTIEFIPEGKHWECKLFFTIFHYLLGTNYMWILVEGLYLHMLISMAVFSERSSIIWFIAFGWASPLLFVMPWVIVRIKLEDVLCWNTNPTVGYFWIMRGPIVTSVVINFIIFLNTIRILFTKLNAFNTFEAKKFRYRKLAKSTLVLIPLFGVHYIVFIGLTENVSEEAELAKLYFEMFFSSFQGLFVTLLFCFLNSEVQSEVRKKWNRYRLSHGNGLRRKSTRDTMSTYASRNRRESAISSSNSGDSHHNGRCCKDTDDVNNHIMEHSDKLILTNGNGVKKLICCEETEMINHEVNGTQNGLVIQMKDDSGV